jgi:16S rRNA (cytidine1402-2'-O)-methyltransferase
MSGTPGRLLIIATPIGNLGDAPPRMVEAMQRCSRIFCEDTRHTVKLLRHFGIDVPLESLHDHNEDAKLERVMRELEGGAVVGIVSDAGTPLLADPGFPIVREARSRGYAVEPIPGPFAGAVALSASGIAPVPFQFLGFAPHREGERLDFYRRVAAAGMTSIVFESPQRLVASLENALAMLGDVEVAVARELTKLHEEILRGTISSLLEDLRARETIYGEITLVFAAAKPLAIELPPAGELRAELERLRAGGMRRNDAIKALGEKYGVAKNELYRMMLEDR